MKLKLQRGDIKRPVFTAAGILGNGFLSSFDGNLPPYVGAIGRPVLGFVLSKVTATREVGNGILASSVAAGALQLMARFRGGAAQ